MTHTSAMFVASGIEKCFGPTVALTPLHLEIAHGETIAVIGPSGSGKTTLLHLLAGVIPPDAGSVLIDGRSLAGLRPGRELARLVGVMHQQYDLVPSLTVIHNVLAGRLGEWSLLRSLVSLVSPRERETAFRALARVGIGEKLYARTAQLSGGEQQRVALARLLVQNPRAILADEPVSSVDPARAEAMIALLTGIAAENGTTLLASLHSVPLALRYFRRVIAIRHGVVLFDRRADEIDPALLETLYQVGDEADATLPVGAR